MHAFYRLMPGPVLPPRSAALEASASDATLVRAASHGDDQACFAIWKKYAPLVQRVVQRYFGPGSEHSDVCQEAFLRVFKRIHEIREPDALAGFVISVTLGVARNESRRQRIRGIVGLRPTDELPPDRDARYNPEAREEVEALYRLLAKLSAYERSLFVARYVEKMEVAEVAVAHHVSLSTAKRHLRKVADRLDHRMRDEPALSDYVGRLLERSLP
jgi:RNA polymerase sigma-70 factor (ECF subfamily)